MGRGHSRWAQEEPEPGGSQGAGSPFFPSLVSEQICVSAVFCGLSRLKRLTLCSHGRGLSCLTALSSFPSPSLSPAPSFLPLHLPIAAPSSSIPWPTLPIPFLSLSQPKGSVSSETVVSPHCLNECLGGRVRWFNRRRLLLSRAGPVKALVFPGPTG